MKSNIYTFFKQWKMIRTPLNWQNKSFSSKVLKYIQNLCYQISLFLFFGLFLALTKN